MLSSDRFSSPGSPPFDSDNQCFFSHRHACSRASESRSIHSPVHVHMSLRKLTHAARMHNRLNFRSSIARVRLFLVSNYWRCQSPSVGSDFYFISRSGTSGCKRRLEVILSHDLNRARRSDCDLSFPDLCSMDADAVLRNKGVRLGIRCQAEGASGAHVVFHQK